MQSLLGGGLGELLITAVFQQTCDGIYLALVESVTGLPTGSVDRQRKWDIIGPEINGDYRQVE